MFFTISWKPKLTGWRNGPITLQPSLGEGRGLAFDGEAAGGVVALYEPFLADTVSFVPGASYVNATDYCGLSLLAEWLREVEQFLPDAVAQVSLCVAALPSHLVAAAAQTTDLTRKLGFDVALNGRSLELSKRAGPKGAVREFRFLAYALDPDGRPYVGDDVRDEMYAFCLERFSGTQEFSSITTLISGGRNAQGTVLGIASPLRDRAKASVRDSSGDHEVPEALRGEFSVRAKRRVRISCSQAERVIERFSRSTVDPRWLFYLPPGMASVQCSTGDYLEHPEGALSYYRDAGINKVVMEHKHMGSRACVLLCKDAETVKRRFGFSKAESLGCVYTRTGRPFFQTADEENKFLAGLGEGLARQTFWERWQTDWVLLDGEILPWSLKAGKLLDDRHGEVLSAGSAMLEGATRELFRFPEAVQLRALAGERLQCFMRYRLLHERYSLERDSPARFAPFQLLATEGRCYFDKTHLWQMQVLGAISRRSTVLIRETPFQVVDLREKAECEKAISWWVRSTEALNEGVVIKPLPIIGRSSRGGIVQPGVKCRGAEHLRLVYGPEYDRFLDALRNRPAFLHRRRKHRRIVDQFVLSIEAARRFVDREPLSRVQECVVAIAALDLPPETSA
jgi:hypothetical protein